MSQVLAGLGAAAGLMRSVLASTFSGSFSATGAGINVASAIRTFTLGAGNGGDVRFEDISGVGTLRYSINAAAFVTFTGGTVITLVSADTLQITCNGLLSGESGSFDLVDVDTGTVIESATLDRS